MNLLRTCLLSLCASAGCAFAQCGANFTYNDFTVLGGPLSDLSLLGSASLEGGVLRLTPTAFGQSGAAWYRLSKASVGTGFESRFRFRLTDGAADGLAFVIQDQSPFAIGEGGSAMGYGNGPGVGITRCVAVEIDTFSFVGEFAAPHISVQTRGAAENDASDSFSLGHTFIPFSILEGGEHEVVVRYQPGTLSVEIDTLPLLTVPLDLHDISGDDILDGECAYVGFTAATGGAVANQDITYWSFSDGSSGGCGASFNYFDLSDTSLLTLVGDASQATDVLRLTPAAEGQRGAAWYTAGRSRVGDGFATEFTFRISNGCADGLAFVIQSESGSAIGDGGSGLGYANNGTAGITRSLAVEIDTFGFGDEFGAPHLSLQSNGIGENRYEDEFSLTWAYLFGIDPCDGEPHTVRIEYEDGTMLVSMDGELFISHAVDLHDILGDDILDGECAWVGFTAGTGGATADQDILSWSFDDEFGGACVPPNITQFPDSSPRTAGQRAEFIFGGTGSGPLEYRWYLNGDLIIDGGRFSGANTDTLVIDPITSADAGQLDFAILNACGSSGSGFFLDVICFADFNQDGGIDGSDVDAFFGAWEAGDFAADVNGDGGVDGADVDTFFGAWEAGACL
ncbi:MAG: hypothetical protein JNK25_04055 [Phycisphaerae bacterium]|nr:hypothetical protein [Phycisphaerae bacterium]